MTKTANDVVTRALKNLNIFDADGDEFADALAHYADTFHPWLQSENRRLLRSSRGSWSANAVPDEVWTRVADILAPELISVIKSSVEAKSEARYIANESHAKLNAYLSVYSRDRSRFPSDLAGRYNTGRFGAYR